ncbi:MAG: hypothetical protein ABIR46_02730, partial [Candidatus Saccharimonadales bacterium]
MKIKQVVPVLAAFAVLAMPVVASAAANSANTVINATVNEVISISTATPVAISLTPTGSGVVSSISDTVTVSTNRTTGYELTLKDTDTSSNLVSGGNNFTPHAGTMAAPTALADNTWGFAIATGTTGAETNAFDASYSAETNSTTSTTKWAGMPTSSGTAYKLKDTTAAASGDTTVVWYAAKATTAQPNGV